jgi:uncharacterized protein (TIGR03435 family)
MRPMLRNLLKERLHPAVHREHRIVAGYALVVVKGGSKLQPNQGALFGGMSGAAWFRFQTPVRSSFGGWWRPR